MSSEYENYDLSELSLVKVRRRRITSRAMMVFLAVIAVCLAVGGLVAPQVMYAREASNFSKVADEANAAAVEAESARVLKESEQLLLGLRSDEVRALVKPLAEMHKSGSDTFSAEFTSSLADDLSKLTDALAVSPKQDGRADLAARALNARELERPDPGSWFDVDSRQLAVLAAVEVEPARYVDVGGTVTLERVHEARNILQENKNLAAQADAEREELSARNAELRGALEQVAGLVSVEAERMAKALLERAGEPQPEEELLYALETEEEVRLREAEDALRASAGQLQRAANTGFFVLDKDDRIVGLAEGEELPEGAIRIPGGEGVRLNYLIPLLEALVEAAVDHSEAAEAAAEAAAARLAAEEQLRIEQELANQQNQSVGGQGENELPPSPDPEETLPDDEPDSETADPIV